MRFKVVRSLKRLLILEGSIPLYHDSQFKDITCLDLGTFAPLKLKALGGFNIK